MQIPGASAPDLSNERSGRDWLLFAFAIACLLPSIGSQSSISGQDEYWLSFRTVLEMMERGEWLTPYVNGEVRLQKPPLLYWAMRGLFETFGPSMFVARIPTVLAGAGFAVVAAKIARGFGGNAMVTGLLALAAAGVAVESRRAMFDLPVACLSSWAVLYGMRWVRSGALASLLAAAVLLAAAAMTKGPVALWFALAPVTAALLVRRARPAGSWLHLVPALLVFCALALPWPIWVQQAHPKFWNVMAEQAEHRSFGLSGLLSLPNIAGAALGLFVPWSIAFASAAWSVLRGRHPQQGKAKWLLTWFGIGLVPFALMSSFERYVLALLVPMALITEPWLATLSVRHLRMQLTAAASLLALPILVFSLFVAWFGLSYVAPLAAAIAWFATWRCARAEQPSVQRTAVCASIALAALLGLVYPAIGINRLPESLPADLSTMPVGTWGRPQPGMLSIVREHSVRQVNQTDPDLAAFTGYLFALEGEAEGIAQKCKAMNKPCETKAQFASFYSRKAWLRFFKDGIGWPQWKEALASRDASPLMPRFVCLAIGPAAPGEANK